jgi:hypothetical protein
VAGLERRVLSLGIALVAGGLGIAAEHTGELSQLRVVGLKKAVQMAAKGWSGSVVYVSVDGRGETASDALLKELADGTHVFKRGSECPRRQMPRLGDFCQPEAGAVEVFIGEVSFLADDLAEANLGYGFGPTSGVSCKHRFKRTGGTWSLVPPEEFLGRCAVS